MREVDGLRFYTADDVNHGRVRAAMKAVGDRMTAAQLTAMKLRGERPCQGLDGRTGLPCNAPSVGPYGHRCADHTAPAHEYGPHRPEDTPTFEPIPMRMRWQRYQVEVDRASLDRQREQINRLAHERNKP